MNTQHKRALSYIKACNKGRSIRISDNGIIEMESGRDFSGNTFWSNVAYVVRSGMYQGWLVDCSGDDERLMVNLA